MNSLQQYIKEIIKKKNHFSNLQCEVKIIDKKSINIVCSKIKLDSFDEINKDMYLIHNDISQLNSTPMINFIFDDCNIKFINKNIDLYNYGVLTFHKCTIEIYLDMVNIDNVHLSYRNFQNCTFENISLFCNIENLHIDLNSSKIKMLQLQHIDISNAKNNKFKIENCEIDRITFWKVTSKIDILFSKINKKFESSQEQLRLMETTFNGRFILKDSFFNSKFELENVTFNKDVSFKNLNILELDLDSTFFNGNNSIDFSQFHIQYKENINRSTFRKIKHLLKKDSNKIEANLYHSYELKARKSELESQSLSSDNFLDKIVFFFNEKTSNHGLNWALPIYWMIFVGLFYSSYFYTSNFNFLESLLFWISILSSIYIFLKFKITKIKKYLFAFLPSFLFYSLITCFNNDFGFNSIFKFLNIINFEKDINISLAESTISKAIMAYLVYQFVVSLRKDTRK